jgi:hypothetical protein
VGRGMRERGWDDIWRSLDLNHAEVRELHLPTTNVSVEGPEG